MPIPEAQLAPARKIPLFGLGTWKAEPGVVKSAVKAAIAAGYRHIDCAAVYQNEAEIGEAFNEVFAEGLVKREDLFITSKLWNTCHKRENALACVRQTLKDLRLEYLDLYLVHWPVAWEWSGLPIKGENWCPLRSGKIAYERTPLHEAWGAMEEIHATGLARSIGVSNWTVPLLLDLLSYCKVPPAVNQIEVHPYNSRAELRAFCASRGIHVTAYSPLGSGKTGPLQDPAVGEIAKAHGATPAQVCVAWAIARGCSAIPKSVSPERIKENLAGASLKLSEGELARIDGLERGLVVCDTRDFMQGLNFFA